MGKQASRQRVGGHSGLEEQGSQAEYLSQKKEKVQLAWSKEENRKTTLSIPP